MVPVPLEGQDDIDHVLQHLGSGNGAFLGDVTDEDHWQLKGLGGENQLGRRLSNLRHGSGCALHPRRMQGLDGVHEQEVRLVLFDGLHDAFGGGLGQDEKVRAQNAEPVGPQAHLLGALLPGNVEHLSLGLHGRLKAEGGLADAGLTAQQNERTGHETTAEDAVEFSFTRADPGAGLLGVVAEGAGLRHAGGHRRPLHARVGALLEFCNGIPGLAAGALPHPLAGHMAAVAADKSRARLGHRSISAGSSPIP